MMIDGTDERLIAAIADGLPLTSRPYAEVGLSLNMSEGQVLSRLRRLISAGVIKRFGVIVHHRELGYRANGMVVWDIPDGQLMAAGTRLAGEDCVTLCYQRPRRLPDWPYNLFCMIHGKDRTAVLNEVARIKHQAGLDQCNHDVLFSERRFKQRGARYALPERGAA